MTRWRPGCRLPCATASSVGPLSRASSGRVRPSSSRKRDDLADDDHRRRLTSAAGAVGGDRAERRCQYLLLRHRAVADHRDRCARRPAALDQLAAMASRCATAISSTSVPVPRARRLPVHGRAGLGRIEVRGDDREVLGDAPMRDRDPGSRPAPRSRSSHRERPGTARRPRTQASASSPPRPNTNGSPPLSLTTR